MGKSSSAFRRLSIITSFLIVSMIILSPTTVKATGEWNWIPTKQAACQGSIGECMAAGFEMESESNRRILATVKYISYGALGGDTVPCSVRGASYYNCQTGAQANPYTRGCSKITQCRNG